MRFRDFLNETGGIPVGNGYNYSWRVPFKRKDGVIVNADFGSHKTLTLLEIWFTKYGHFTNEELKNLRVEPSNKFFGGMKWDEAYEKYRKIRLKRKNLEQYYIKNQVSEARSKSSGNKIVPKNRHELDMLVEDESVYLGDIEIQKHITDFSNLFEDSQRKDFSGLETWDVSNVTDMNYMFAGAKYFTGKGIENWNVSNVTNMSYMFYEATNFNSDISRWNVSKVKNMEAMFFDARKFNQPIGKWNVSNVTMMSEMFYRAKNFNQPLDKWNTSNVLYITGMFQGADSFNQPLNSWNTGNVKSMYSMFADTKKFNQPLDKWNLKNCGTLDYMFRGAKAFNQEKTISIWKEKFPNKVFNYLFG